MKITMYAHKMAAVWVHQFYF